MRTCSLTKSSNVPLQYSKWTDFQLAIMIAAHDTDFQWISEEAKADAALRLRMKPKEINTMHHSFQLPCGGCNGGFPMPRDLAKPVEGRMDISAAQVQSVLKVMVKIPALQAFSDCGSTPVRYEYLLKPPVKCVIPPTHAERMRVAKLREVCDQFEMFEIAYRAVDNYMSYKNRHLYALFKEKHGSSHLPSQCFINYYQSNREIRVPKHRDRVPFCTLSLSLTRDEGCLSIWQDVEFTTYKFDVGSYVIYDRIWHSVQSEATDNARCSINLFY